MIAEVSVVPKSRKFSISVKEDRVKIFLKSPAEHNKANLELVKELSKLLKADVRIISGFKSRCKRLEIAADRAEWEALLHTFKKS